MNLFACSTCAVNYSASGNSIGWSIFALLLLILAVLGGVAFFMIRLIRRDNANLDPELRDDYVHQ
jgi:ATP/ADP translocase